MELIKFDTTNIEAGARGRTSAPKIIIRNGKFVLNRGAVEVMDIKAGDTVALYQHPKNNEEWYIGVDEKGFELKEEKGGLFFSSSALSVKIKEAVACPKSWGLKFIVSVESDFPYAHALVGKEVMPSKDNE